MPAAGPACRRTPKKKERARLSIAEARLSNCCNTMSGWIEMVRNGNERTLGFKGYTCAGFAEKVYHLHIKPSGDWDELYFRDYLREHSGAAREYETLKLLLQKQHEHNRDAYTNAKSAFVMECSQRAREEFGGRYVPVL